MELVLKKVVKFCGGVRSIYDIGGYNVLETVCEDGYLDIEIRRNPEYSNYRYTPEIYCKINSRCTAYKLEIQTTSYGTLSVNEIGKVARGLNEAAEVAVVLDLLLHKTINSLKSL